MQTQTPAFYEALTRSRHFADLARKEVYTPLPDDWLVGCADVQGSTQAVEAGQYKTVNMVGAAVISAQINGHEGAGFPYIFGGDGAGFAVPAAWKPRAAAGLAEVQAWALREFSMVLRVALVPVADIRSARFDVSVARFQVSDAVDYAMFAGGGLGWAERQMKAGRYEIPPAGRDAVPDLVGLSCRWSHMRSRYGTVLSLVIAPVAGVSDTEFSAAVQEVLAITDQLERAGHPAEDIGPGTDWPPKGAGLEAHAQRGRRSLGAARRKALFESLVAWLLIRTGIKLGGFDARRYRAIVGGNADFRKFEDGLKMTLDCDPETEAQVLAVLERGQGSGVLRYGVHRQDEAMMTCFVPSPFEDNHVHFVDGAAGGYTAAAKQIKAAEGG